MQNKKVVIFGVFDGIHEGHLFLINEAKRQGGHLVATVARDSIIKELKGKLPKYSEEDRVKKLLSINDIDLVLLGDPKRETYNVLKEVKPDIIFLGYDQKKLFDNINKMIKRGDLPKMEILQGSPFKPEIYHSSILNKEGK
jgi:FAD synthetase